MKKLEVPPAISAAAVAMLSPYAPGLTPAKLECAIAFESVPESTERLLDRRETAVALHISLPTVDRMLNGGELTRINVRGRVFIRRSEIDRIVSGNKQAVQE
jgi:hypothetical protein